MVFQSYALYPNMSVAQNMAFGMEMRGVPKPERDKAVAEVAKTLQIEHLLSRRPSQLSGGQRQRVAMGRALVRQPRVFLFDEPLSNLDAKLRVDMRVEIKRLHQQHRRDDRLRHARPDRGDDAGHQDRRSEGRRVAAGRHAVRNLQHARQPVRRRFHGLAVDEPARGQGDARERRREDRARAQRPRADRPCRRRRAPTRQARRRRQGHLWHPA